MDQHTALTLSVKQTLSQEEIRRNGPDAHLEDKDEKTTRMQQYLDHIRTVAPHLTDCEHYLVVNGSFANADFSRYQYFPPDFCPFLHQIKKLDMPTKILYYMSE